MNPRHAIALIEAAYRLDLSTEPWLAGIAKSAAAALGSNQGAMAFRYDASSGDWVNSGLPVLHGLPPEFARDFFNQPNMPREAAIGLAKSFMSVRFHSSRGLFDGLGVSATMGPIFDRYGIGDLIGVNGLDPSGIGCVVAIVDRKRSYSPRTVRLWHRLAAHISAGNRLRIALEALTRDELGPLERAEAVLTSNGKIEHASGPAEPRSARDALRDALARIDAARAEEDDGGRSIELWRGLVAGRWSLVEHFERDGRRYYLAHKNDPELRHDGCLTPRERQVLGYAELGHSNKLIAYALGLAASTVSALLNRAKQKLGQRGT